MDIKLTTIMLNVTNKGIAKRVSNKSELLIKNKICLFR